jgi:hypothetical protein
MRNLPAFCVLPTSFLPAAPLLFGNNRQFGKSGSRHADALEAFRHDAVGGGKQADQQIHGGNLRPLMIERTLLSLTKEPDNIIGEEFPVRYQESIGLSFFLVEQFLELSKELGQVGPQSLPPVTDTDVGHGQETHEHMGTANAVPVGLAGQPQGVGDGIRRGFFEQFLAETTSRQENIRQRSVRGRHAANPLALVK